MCEPIDLRNMPWDKAQEIRALMMHDAYQRRRGAISQTHHTPDTTAPDHCYGCAWANQRGSCLVFVDVWDAWVSGDDCESYATEKERDCIEFTIRGYARQRHREHVPADGEMAGQAEGVEATPGV